MKNKNVPLNKKDREAINDFAPDKEEKYREAGVEGNDQNAAIRNAGTEPVLGNAEASERGKTEFRPDQGVPDDRGGKVVAPPGGKSERGKAEFEKDRDLSEGADL